MVALIISCREIIAFPEEESMGRITHGIGECPASLVFLSKSVPEEASLGEESCVVDVRDVAFCS